VSGYSTDMAATLVQDPTAELDATHRCDRCGAQAYVRAMLEDWAQPLLFCGHHFKDHKTKLNELGAWVHDETDKLYTESQLMKQATTEV